MSSRCHRPQAVAIALAAMLALLGACAGLASARAVALPRSSPFAGTALWVDLTSPLLSPQQIAAGAAAAGARTLFVKAGDGSTAEAELSPVLVGQLRAAGETVCAWTFAYGQSPLAEAAVAVAAVRDGAQCLVVDAEGQYDGLYGAAQMFVRSLRAQLGAQFPIGLAGQAEVERHPQFPYSVFLGPGGFDVDLPQVYWRDFGVSVEHALAVTVAANAIYGRPIAPVGQLYGAPAPAELLRFRGLAAAYGLPGASFFDFESAQPEALAALAAPPVRLARRATLPATVRSGADGDEVVWAQELLDAAGAHLPVGGFLGAETARAIASFQARHRLRPNGALGPATWQALLRFHAREPSWAAGPPDSVR